MPASVTLRVQSAGSRHSRSVTEFAFPFARFRCGTFCPALCPGVPTLRRAAVQEALPLYPRGPWLRCGLCCPTPSSLTTTPSASLVATRRLHGRAAYTSRLPWTGAPRRPTRPSLLSLPLSPHVPSTVTPVGPWHPPVVLVPRYQASSISERVATHEYPPLPAILDGDRFRRCIVRVMLRPACLPSPPDWLRRHASLPPHPAFRGTVSLPLLARGQISGTHGDAAVSHLAHPPDF